MLVKTNDRETIEIDTIDSAGEGDTVYECESIIDQSIPTKTILADGTILINAVRVKDGNKIDG